MKTLQRLIYADLYKALVFVTLVLLSLLYFFDLIDEIPDVGKTSTTAYTLAKAFLYTATLLPRHLYEILPIAALIACTFVMARFAQTQEFTVMRTSGLAPLQALRLVLGFGLGLAFFCFLLGDYGVPIARQFAETIKNPSLTTSHIYRTETGVWLKASQADSELIVNLHKYNRSKTSMHGVRIYQFDPQGRIQVVIQAKNAHFEDAQTWLLQDLERITFTYAVSQDPASGPVATANPPIAQNTQAIKTPSEITRERLSSQSWPSPINQTMVESSALRPERMNTWDLYQQIKHLESSKQNAQAYEIEFWRKILYPFSCVVMVVLALPFAYLHFRSGNIAGFVFIGVLIGVSFFLLNNMFGYLGYLHQWAPWLAAGAPSLIYSVISLVAFTWLVLRH